MLFPGPRVPWQYKQASTTEDKLLEGQGLTNDIKNYTTANS